MKFFKDLLKGDTKGSSSSSSSSDGEKNEMVKQEKLNEIKTVVVTPSRGGGKSFKTSFKYEKVVGSGNFGVVFQATMVGSEEKVAIKKTHVDKKFKSRELQIMKSLRHHNVVALKYFFYSNQEEEQIYLNLVLEYVPESLNKVIKQFRKIKQTIPISFIKLYMYQLMRGLAYIHSLDICHRDMKPHNILVNQKTGALKICDFGSAKFLIKGEKNVAYICSRFYRAPELIFGSVNYSTEIDVWSGGCVMATILLGQPLFQGESSLDQLVEIINVLGTPSENEIKQMNPDYEKFDFPKIEPRPWENVFRPKTPPDAIALISKLLSYVPSSRLTPLEACAEKFFDELRKKNTVLPNGTPLPPLFDFSNIELGTQHHLKTILIPKHVQNSELPR